MIAAIIPIVSGIQTAVTAAAPYAATWASTAIKVAPVVAALNVTMRAATRGGANYVRKTNADSKLDDFVQTYRTNPTMSKENLDEMAQEVPTQRPSTWAQKLAWGWNVTWTSLLATVGSTYAVITLPIYAAAWVLGKTTCGLSSLVLAVSRRMGVKRTSAEKGRATMHEGTETFIKFFRALTWGAGMVLTKPYNKGIFDDINEMGGQFAESADRFADAGIKLEEDLKAAKEKVNEVFEKVATPTPEPVRVRPVATDIFGNGPGMSALRDAYIKVCAQEKWPDTHIYDNPTDTAVHMHVWIQAKKRTALAAATESALSFAFDMGLSGGAMQQFAVTFADPDTARVEIP